MADFFADQKWFDPGLEKYGIGYAKAMTRFLYQNIVPQDKFKPEFAEDWPRYGLITQFDRVLTFVLDAGAGTTAVQTLQTNNRNWMLISRAALCMDTATMTDATLGNILVNCNADPGIQLMENQPASLVFGDGQLPHIMLMPEEWPTNTFRRWTVTNNSGIARTVYLSFKFLQVRTAG